MTNLIYTIINCNPITATVRTHLEVTCDPAFDEAWINGVRYVPAEPEISDEEAEMIAAPWSYIDPLEPSRESPGKEVSEEELVLVAREALGSWQYGSELPYFLRQDSSEYEPLMLMLRATYDLACKGKNNKSFAESSPENG